MLVVTALLLVPSTNVPPMPEIAPEIAPTMAILPAAPLASDKPGFSYTYVEGNFIRLDSDAGNDNLRGIELIGSLELPLNFFVQGTGTRLTGDVDLNSLQLGAGWHFSLGDTIDAYGVLSYVDHNYNSGISDQDGVLLDAGARLMINPKIEVNGYGEWADVEKDALGLGLGGRYYLSDNLSLGLRVLFIDTGDQWAAGLRFAF